MTFRNVTVVVALAAGLGTAAAVAAPKDRTPPRAAPVASVCPAPPAPATTPSAALLERFGVLRAERRAEDALPTEVRRFLTDRGVGGFAPERARLLRTGPNGAKAWVVPLPDVRRASFPSFGCLIDARRRPASPVPPATTPRAGRAPALPVPPPVVPAVPPTVPTVATGPAPAPPTAPAPTPAVPPAVGTTPARVPPPAPRPALPAPAPAPRRPAAQVPKTPRPALPAAAPQPALRPLLRHRPPLLPAPAALAFPGGQVIAPLGPAGGPLEGVVVVTQAGAANGGGGALEDLLKGRAAVSVEPCADGRADLTRISGLVPDGVDRVFLTADDGSAVEARPGRNGYVFTVPVKAGAPQQRYVVWTPQDGTPRVQAVVLRRVPKRLACTFAASTARTIGVGPIGRPVPTASLAGGRTAAARRG